MFRFRFPLGVVCTSAALAFGLTSEPVWSADPAKPAAPAIPPSIEESADPFAVPDTNDEKALQMFLQRLIQTQPPTPTPEAITAHLTKIDEVVAKVLAKPINDQFYRGAAELRLQIYSVLTELGDPAAKEKTAAFLKELSTSTRQGVAVLSSRFLMQQRVEKIGELEPEAQQKLVDEIVAAVKVAPKGDDEALQFNVQLAMTAGELLQRSESKIAVPAFAAIVEAIKGRNDERLADLVSSLEGTLRRLQLPGNPIEVQGTTLNGQPFDIASLKGQVVLVDFWATWCGPCIAEMPHLKELYEAYHSKGFEVVGVSLDSEKDDLEGFMKTNEIKWPVLFEEASEKSWDNKIAVRYGISAIPTMILVDRTGKVISTQIRGPLLDEELAKLLGPLPEKKAEKKAETKKAD